MAENLVSKADCDKAVEHIKAAAKLLNLGELTYIEAIAALKHGVKSLNSRAAV